MKVDSNEFINMNKSFSLDSSYKVPKSNSRLSFKIQVVVDKTMDNYTITGEAILDKGKKQEKVFKLESKTIQANQSIELGCWKEDAYHQENVLNIIDFIPEEKRKFCVNDPLMIFETFANGISVQNKTNSDIEITKLKA